AGFGADTALEWLDGYMTALAASRRQIALDEWLPQAFGDAFERAFADPQDAAQARATLQTHWDTLVIQLDAESLIDAPDVLRLGPLMVSYDDAARAEVVAAGHMDEAEAQQLLQTGALWTEGFREATEHFADDWPEPDEDTEEGRWYDDCLMRVMALALTPEDLAEHLATQYPGETLERDQLVDEACFGVQDLRVYWLDHAPKPATRRVGEQPGRNDPCPCGSGKKFKKCHGA
ncbi:MAG: zinc chelation protein SecC, partial [Burkholderiales bacterium PBB5]